MSLSGGSRRVGAGVPESVFCSRLGPRNECLSLCDFGDVSGTPKCPKGMADTWPRGVTAVGVGGMVDPAVDQLAVEEE